MGLGIWLLIDPNVTKLLSIAEAAYNSGLLRVSAILILSTGCAVFLISFLGFFGAILEFKAILGIVRWIYLLSVCMVALMRETN